MERDNLGRFVKGMKPHNYGMSMPKELKEKLEIEVYSKRRGKSYEEIYGEDKSKEVLKHQRESFTKERLDNITLKRKGMKLSEEHKKNIGLGNIGRIVSKETREKKRKTMTGQKRSMEARMNISLGKKGKKRNVESVKKMIETMKYQYTNGLRKKGMLGYKLNQEQRDNISKRMTLEKHPNWMGGLSYEP